MQITKNKLPIYLSIYYIFFLIKFGETRVFINSSRSISSSSKSSSNEELTLEITQNVTLKQSATPSSERCVIFHLKNLFK